MFENRAAWERECWEGTPVSDPRTRVPRLQTGINRLIRAGHSMSSLHTQTAATRGMHKEHNPSIYPRVRSLALGTKTHRAKKPRAQCLDRHEVTKDQSGLGLGFSFTTSSKLWLCQKEKNEGSLRELFACPPPSQPNNLPSLRLSLFLAHPMAPRSGSAT